MVKKMKDTTDVTSNFGSGIESTEIVSPGIPYETSLSEKLYCKELAELCKPNPATQHAQQQKAVLKTSGGDDAFIVTERSLELPCILESLKSPSGDFQGETFCPATTAVQEKYPNLCRSVRFHGCTSSTGEHFLLIEKLAAGNSWNLSKQEAISRGRKCAIVLRTNAEQKMYECSTADVEIADTLDEAAFDTLCEQAFGGLIIDSPDHPVLKRLLPSGDIWEGV